MSSEERLLQFRNRSTELYRSRPDLQKAFPMGSPEHWMWALYHGVQDDPLLAETAPPLPPEELRRMIGAPDSNDFQTSGMALFAELTKMVDFRAAQKLLDFGCGCGRLLRFFSLFVPTAALYGVDLDGAAIDWLNRNLPFAACYRNSALPPLQFESRFFDSLVALSVFSHLPEAAHRAWIEEFARIVVPGGTVVVTTLGPAAIETGRDNLSILGISADAFDEAVSQYLCEGFSFVQQADCPIADYGTTFASEKWIRKHWGRHFTTITYHRGIFGNWQDGYVMVRDSSPAPGWALAARRISKRILQNGPKLR